MGNFMFIFGNSHHIVLDWSDQICPPITFYISRMDVSIPRWLEKTLNHPQNLVDANTSFVLFTSFGK